jgi:hypothetical protein
MMAIMAQHGVFPAQPERADPAPRLRWSTGVFLVWLVLLVGTAVAGVYLTVVTIPPGQDLFESPMLEPAICVLALPAALAGWFVPHAAPFWGLAIVPPYLVGFWLSWQTHPSVGADLSFIGFFFLFGMVLVPTGCALAAGLTRRAIAKAG